MFIFENKNNYSRDPRIKIKRKLHGSDKRKISHRQNNNGDNESNNAASSVSVASAQSFSHPVFNAHEYQIHTNLSHKKTKRRKTSMVGYQTSYAVSDDQTSVHSRVSDSFDGKNGSKLELGCKIAAHCLGNNLSSEELSSYLTNCIQMNAANKINKGNAFSLQLIDYMLLLLKRNDKAMNDFPTLSCSLDASSKIYSCRVDNVYAVVMGIASGLASVTEKSKRKVSKSDNEDLEESEVVNCHKQARKRKSKKAISSSLEAICRNSVEIAHWMKRPAIRLDPTSLLSYASNTKSDESLLSMLQDHVPLVPKLRNKQVKNTMLSIPSDGSKSCQVLSCQLSKFNFSWEGDESSDDELHNNCDCITDKIVYDVLDNNSKSSLIIQQDSTPNQELVDDYDDNNSDNNSNNHNKKNDVDIDDNEFDDDNDAVNDDDDAMNDGHDEVESKENVRRIDALSLVSEKALLTANDSIYSYFDENLLPNVWLGPEYWKPNLTRDKPAQTSEKVSNKNKEKNWNNKFISFDESSDDDCKFDVKCNQKLREHIMATWSEKKLMHPYRANYKIHDLFCSFLRNTLFFKPHLNKEEVELSENKKVDEMSVVKFEIEYSNNGELLFECIGELPLVDENGSIQSNKQYDFDDADHSEATSADEEEPVIATICNPNIRMPIKKLIQQDNTIKYATVPKRLDMKLMKNRVWDLLDFESDEATTAKSPCIRNNGEVLFSDVYKHLPNYLPNDILKDTSPSLVFLTILHLANEKNLSIESVGESKTDLRIKKDFLDGSNNF